MSVFVQYFLLGYKHHKDRDYVYFVQCFLSGTYVRQQEMEEKLTCFLSESFLAFTNEPPCFPTLEGIPPRLENPPLPRKNNFFFDNPTRRSFNN